MILKCLSSKSPGSEGRVIKYICRYITNPEKQIGKSQFLIRHNVKGKSLDGWIKQFKENVKARKFKRSDMTIVHHSIISFSPKSKKFLTDAKLKAIAKEYIRQHSASNMYLISKHDKNVEHTHMHICMSSGNLRGFSSAISHSRLAEIKMSMSEYILKTYPELSDSIVRHGNRSKKIQEKKPQFPERFHTQKLAIKDIVENSLSRVHSFRELEIMLNQEGLQAYYQNSNPAPKGITFENGRKYRFSTLGIKDQIEALQQEEEREKNNLSELRSLREKASEERENENEYDEEREEQIPAERNQNEEENSKDDMSDQMMTDDADEFQET